MSQSGFAATVAQSIAYGGDLIRSRNLLEECFWSPAPWHSDVFVLSRVELPKKFFGELSRDRQ